MALSEPSRFQERAWPDATLIERPRSLPFGSELVPSEIENCLDDAKRGMENALRAKPGKIAIPWLAHNVATNSRRWQHNNARSLSGDLTIAYFD